MNFLNIWIVAVFCFIGGITVAYIWQWLFATCDHGEWQCDLDSEGNKHYMCGKCHRMMWVDKVEPSIVEQSIVDLLNDPNVKRKIIEHHDKSYQDELDKQDDFGKTYCFDCGHIFTKAELEQNQKDENHQ